MLEREKAELDDRVGALETQLAATDKLAAQDFATKVNNRQTDSMHFSYHLLVHSYSVHCNDLLPDKVCSKALPAELSSSVNSSWQANQALL